MGEDLARGWWTVIYHVDWIRWDEVSPLAVGSQLHDFRISSDPVEVLVGKGDRWHLSVSKVSLAPFHNFSPTPKSLRVDATLYQYPRPFNLVR